MKWPSPESRPSPVDQVRVPRRNRLSDLHCSDFVDIPGRGKTLRNGRWTCFHVGSWLWIEHVRFAVVHTSFWWYSATRLFQICQVKSPMKSCVRESSWVILQWNTVDIWLVKIMRSVSNPNFLSSVNNHLQLLTSAESNLQWNGLLESSKVILQ